ncbi:TRAP transporter small permease [Halobacterium bonnevillei]|uniref:TRAP transporter small permease subunit n=1 Tax=Halobacterium bonnevillei TaxID=2692200 RepID=A0A6B0SF38_9EURY|nr:TRAP transporter small permease [Halobacterium bonnevillei]MXR20188.1 TRAP transporter small permease subunit [Halobacterium bonnevillei]
MTASRLWFDRVASLFYGLAALSLLAILALMIARVLSRNLGLGFSGLQIVAQLLEVWLAFLVVGGLALDDGHIEIDYLSRRIPERWQPIHDILVSLVTLWATAVVFFGSVQAIQRFADSTSPVIDIPIPLYYLAPIVGLGFLIAVLVRRIVIDVQEVRA